MAGVLPVAGLARFFSSIENEVDLGGLNPENPDPSGPPATGFYIAGCPIWLNGLLSVSEEEELALSKQQLLS